MFPFYFRLSRELRSRGKRDFILRYGLMRFGVTLGVVAVVTKYVEIFGLTIDGLHSTEFLLYAVIWFLGMGLGAGWMFGALFWRFAAGHENDR
jgi:hypothetical protein